MNGEAMLIFLILEIVLFRKQYLKVKYRESLEQNENMIHVAAAAAAAKSLQSCSTLRNPINGSPPGSPHPWDSPGKNTGVGCHFLLQCMKVKSESESLSRVRLFATPWTATYQAPLSMGFSRQEYRSGLPLPSPRKKEMVEKHKVPETVGN